MGALELCNGNFWRCHSKIAQCVLRQAYNKRVLKVQES